MRKQKNQGPTGAIVSGTPIYGSPVSPVIGSPAQARSPANAAYVGPPAYAPGRELPSAPPYPSSTREQFPSAAPPSYAAGPPATYVTGHPAFVDQEAGPPAQKPRIKQNRKCRDIVFLILFLAFGIGFIIETSFGFNKGDPRRYTSTLFLH